MTQFAYQIISWRIGMSMGENKIQVPKLNGKTLDCPIFIATSNDYLPMLRVFSCLFNIFWSTEQEVTFLGYKSPSYELPENFKFVSLGPQRGIQYWSEDIKNFLSSVENDYFIYTAEDMLLCRPVNFNNLENIFKLCSEKKLTPDRIALGNSVSMQDTHTLKSDINGDILLMKQDARYRLSLQWGIWKKEYFLRYLHNGYSQWDYEVKNMPRAQNDYAIIMGNATNHPLGHCNALQSRGNVGPFDFSSAILNFRDETSHPDPKKRTYIEEKYIDLLIRMGYISMENIKRW